MIGRVAETQAGDDRAIDSRGGGSRTNPVVQRIRPQRLDTGTSRHRSDCHLLMGTSPRMVVNH
jgi:hypothetical protein